MHIEERKNAFIKLGKVISALTNNQAKPETVAGENINEFEQEVRKAELQNGWFTQENIKHAFDSISDMLNEDSLTEWLSQYPSEAKNNKVGVVMAGNIPLVGFHDVASVLLSGNTLVARLSSDDKILLPFLLGLLSSIEPRFSEQIKYVDKIKGIDAVIATGSNNSVRYFEYYFGKYPHIIRKNRSGVAIISGSESEKELNLLGKDIFTYFGLGCRSVSKLFVPVDYNFDQFFNAIYKYGNIINHNKYANNYDYNRAIYLMSKEKILDNGFLLLKEDAAISSPLGVLFYEYYNNDNLNARLEMDKENIQCIVGEGHLTFGTAQQPGLSDYADNIDTMEFLSRL